MQPHNLYKVIPGSWEDVLFRDKSGEKARWRKRFTEALADTRINIRDYYESSLEDKASLPNNKTRKPVTLMGHLLENYANQWLSRFTSSATIPEEELYLGEGAPISQNGEVFVRTPAGERCEYVEVDISYSFDGFQGFGEVKGGKNKSNQSQIRINTQKEIFGESMGPFLYFQGWKSFKPGIISRVGNNTLAIEFKRQTQYIKNRLEREYWHDWKDRSDVKTGAFSKKKIF